MRLELPDDLLQRLQRLAAPRRQSIEAFAASALEDYVRSSEDCAEPERRAKRGSLGAFDHFITKGA